MTKTELVAHLADKAGLTKVDAGKALDALEEIITSALKKGEAVTWTGFGTFERKLGKARMGRNPHTKTPMHLPASYRPTFKSGKTFSDSIKNR